MPNTTGDSIAEELSAQQREISVAEFFEQNRQMLGFGSKARAMVTAVKEGVDNAIDASEDAGILPEVHVTITETDDGYYELTITDNGPGITKEQVPKVFGKLLYGSRFAKRVQSRGQQGIGISAAVMYSQLTSGKSAEVTSKIEVEDQAEYFKVGIDTDENEPRIRESRSVDWEHGHESGTSITMYMEASFRARSSLHKYIEHTAIVNPHATIELDEPERHARFERTVDTLPEQPTEINPHPHGIEFGTLRSLIEVTDSHSISGFLQSEFTRVGQTTAEDIINAFQDRVDGRYCTWRVPDPDAEIPLQAVTNGTPCMPSELPATEENGEDDEDQADVETITLCEHIKAHVNRKSPEATTAFATNVAAELHDAGSVSWVTVQETVESVAETVVSEYDTTLGDTVREKAASAAWDVIRTTRQQTLVDLVDDATSDRKTTDDVTGFTSELSDHITDAESPADSFTKDSVREFVEQAADRSAKTISNAFGETARENVFNALWDGMDRTPDDPPLLRELKTDRDLADALHQAMQETDVMAPPSHCLSPIGEESLLKGMEKVYDADFYASSTRDASAHSGEPFLVEAGIAHGGDIKEDGDVSLLRFANRVPLVYQQGACCVTSVVSGIRWNNYKISDKGSGLPQGPIAIIVHVASTNVPFTSESKDAIASVDVIEDEIERAVRDVALDLKKHLKKQRTLRKRQQKQDTIAQILPEFSKKISSMADKPQPRVTQSLAQIMNNLFVAVDTDTGDTNRCTATAANFDNQSTYTPSVRVHTDKKPQIGESLDLVVDEIEGGWVIKWEPTVNQNEERTVELGIEPGTITDLTVAGIPGEKVTSTLSQSVQA